MKVILPWRQAALVLAVLCSPIPDAFGVTTPVLVKDIDPGPGTSFPRRLTNVGGTLVLAANNRLWRSDGTAAGTVKIFDVEIDYSDGFFGDPSIISVGDIAYFRGRDATHGFELWRTDGTAAGTLMVRDFAPGSADGYPAGFNVVGNTLIFATGGGTLWKIDLPEGQPTLIPATGSLSGQPFVLGNGTVVVHVRKDASSELWNLDVATGNATRSATIAAPNFTKVGGNLLYFDAKEASELWRSDGTTSGTFALHSHPDNASGFAPIGELIGSIGSNFLYMVAARPGVRELWRSDGTVGGTIPLVTPFQGTAMGLVTVKGVGYVLFATGTGAELWRSDGSVAGTFRLKTIPNVISSAFYNIDDTIYFFATNNPSNPYSTMTLWRSDGTAEGTVSTGTIFPAEAPNVGRGLVRIGNTLYFAGDDTIVGGELWRADLNVTPTEPAANFQGLWWRSPASSEPGWGVNVSHQGDVVFATWFTYDTDGSGMWLVMSEGRKTAEYTYSGTLYRTTGPAFSTASWNVQDVHATPVGSGTLTFSSDAASGRFDYTVNGITQSKAITRLLFSSPVPQCYSGGNPGTTPNYQDMWWRSPGGSESGWGVNLTHQGDLLFATWFTYGLDGRGQWLVASEVRRGNGQSFTGPLYRATGPAFSAVPWNAGDFRTTQVGSVTFTFSDANNGTFGYTVDGVTQAKPITRHVFQGSPTVCR